MDTVKTLETDPFLVDGAVAKCGTCADSGFPRFLRNDPIYTSMGLWVRDRAGRAGNRPPTPATYPTLTCGAVWEKNTTWTEESIIDYFAVVDSDHFKTRRKLSKGATAAAKKARAGQLNKLNKREATARRNLAAHDAAAAPA